MCVPSLTSVSEGFFNARREDAAVLTAAHTLEVVAEKLGVDERTVRAWVSNGEIRAVNLSRDRHSKKPRLRIMEDEIERFLESRSTEPIVKKSRRKVLPPVEKFV